MPPKGSKQSAPALAPSPATDSPVPPTVTTPRGKTYDTTAAAGRPKRNIATTMPPPDPPSAKRAKRVSTSSASEVTPKRRGRPPKALATTTPKSAPTATPKTTPKAFRVGERQSARLASTPASETSLPTVTRRRGPATTKSTKSRVTKSALPPIKRGRGRPPKAKKPVPSALDDNEAEDANDDASDGIEYDDPTHDANITEATTIIQADRNYWLMKAEPESRIEKNANGDDVDVKFSIDDLRARTEPEPWEGIRNAQAQNNMKAMRVGDLAFFYESNCKKPGIVGVMEIVGEATPDTHAFDKHSAYYDPKSNPAKPKWILVHVEFRRKFDEKYTLKDLQKFSQPGGALAGMELFKQSRLSITKVAKQQWDFIMNQIGEDEQDSFGAELDEADMGDEDMEDLEASTNSDRIDEDMGNDFAAAFEAPANLGTTPETDESAPDPAAKEIPDVVDQLSAHALGTPAPIPADRSVSRGRSRRQASLPAGKAPPVHSAALPAKHSNDAPAK
ncbi:unnamed protein product [Aureobasidium pullulans]|nr:unnamed protein product [Aureobasidium pullulans]